MTYQEIITSILKECDWTLEDLILSRAVRIKYGIAKAGSKKKSSAFSALRAGHKEGLFRMGFESARKKTFWGIGTGEPEETVILDNYDVHESIPDGTLLASARSNVQKIERRLTEISTKLLTARYGSDWVNNLEPRTIQDIKKEYSKTNNNPWVPGSYKELLEATGFGSYVYIIRDKWFDVYKDYFFDKEITVGKLKELSYYRNAITHNPGTLSKLDLIFYNSAVDLFLEKFKPI